MLKKVTPVILCGGSGTRLWPLSRSGFPKQFLCLTGTESLFQLAARRAMSLGADDIEVAPPLIVSNEEHRFLATEQLREIGIQLGAALLEPVGRNTAPALTLAALAAAQAGEDPILVVTPADQTITDLDAYTLALQTAIREAAGGSIVVLGVTPTGPETGYGYIKTQSSANISKESNPSAQDVDSFAEKPSLATAEAYISQGGYYWNAGMFVLRASTWLSALKNFRPDIAEATMIAWNRSSEELKTGSDFIRPNKDAFKAIPAESIDYAVMEPASQLPGAGENRAFPLRMVALNAGWNDLGAWDAVWQVQPKDKDGNVHWGDVLATDSRNNLIHATSRLVGVVGVENLVVIETADAVLVADKGRCQDVKAIVNAINANGREEHMLHRKVHRPWGWYDSIDEEERFKVKRIQVKPGASLSLQMHHHRAEHWIVVKGTAQVTCGDEIRILGENQSTYIPLGTVHRLSNPGNIPLEIIEVQSGSYLGEDDIVRLEDRYGR